MSQIKVVDEASITLDNKIRVGTAIHGRGDVVKVYETLTPQKSQCQGCTDDFYNGKNALGVQECWGFRTAKVVDKVGYSSIHVAGGPDTKMVKTLSCWHAVRK